MRTLRGFAALLVLAAVAAFPALAQKDKDKAKDKPKDTAKPDTTQEGKLEWKFEKDKTFYQEIATKTEQVMKITGQTITQTQSQTFYFSWTPKSYDAKAKTWTIVQKIIGVKMEIEIGGNKISYDSTKESTQSNPLGDFFKQLVDSEFTLTVGEDMKIQKVEGREKFIDKLTKANAQMEPLLKDILSEDALKQMADPAFAALPGKDVKLEKGAKWDRESTLNMGPIGKYKTKYTYTYAGPEKDNKDLVKIDVSTKLDYTPPDAKNQPQLPFKIVKANLKPKKSSGSIVFDLKKGRVDKSHMEIDLEGDLDIEIGGQTTKVELTQNQKTNVTTTDKDPLKK